MVTNLERTKDRFIPETVIGITCNNVQAHPNENSLVLGKVMTPYFKGTNLITPGPVADRLRLLTDTHIKKYPDCGDNISYLGNVGSSTNPVAFTLPK